MNNIVSLDYELFFGANSGDAISSIITPTRKLLSILDPLSIKATFFVDIGYLSRADELQCDQVGVSAVKRQIKELVDNGHDIQLHIHPHWENTQWRNGKWSFDLTKYKLSDFSKSEASKIVHKYASKLQMISDKPVIAYRAGGWCLQPFGHFSDALKEVGIEVDSTVFVGGKNESAFQAFDFSDAPDLPFWRFENDPLEVESEGGFFELPISSLEVSPIFYWKFALAKKLGGKKHLSFGNGSAAPISRQQLKRLLTKKSRTVASIDGYKASLLQQARAEQAKKFGHKGPLVLIGHPKALTPYSLKILSNYIRKNKDDSYSTISDYYESTK